MPRPSKFSPAARARFCEVLEDQCVVGKACEAVGISRQTAYDHRAKDKEFAEAWDNALETGVDRLEREAWRRGVEGVDEPIVYKGVITGTVKRYSDDLLVLLLRAHRPEKYRETRRVKVSVPAPGGDGPIAETLRHARVMALLMAGNRTADPLASPMAPAAAGGDVGEGERAA